MALATGFTSNSSSSTNTSGITAHAGGGQSEAVLLTSTINQITTAALNSSVKFPLAIVSKNVEIYNDGANAIDAYPFLGDKFIDLAINIPVSVPAGGKLIVYCFATGIWSY